MLSVVLLVRHAVGVVGALLWALLLGCAGAG